MSKEMTIIALGIWVIIVPYLGVPGSWRTAILVLSGIAIAVMGFMLRGEAIARGSATSDRTARSFTESAVSTDRNEEPETATSFE